MTLFSNVQSIANATHATTIAHVTSEIDQDIVPSYKKYSSKKVNWKAIAQNLLQNHNMQLAPQQIQYRLSTHVNQGHDFSEIRKEEAEIIAPIIYEFRTKRSPVPWTKIANLLKIRLNSSTKRTPSHIQNWYYKTDILPFIHQKNLKDNSKAAHFSENLKHLEQALGNIKKCQAIAKLNIVPNPEAEAIDISKEIQSKNFRSLRSLSSGEKEQLDSVILHYAIQFYPLPIEWRQVANKIDTIFPYSVKANRLQERYTNILAQKLDTSPIKAEEETLINKLAIEYPNNWVTIASMLQEQMKSETIRPAYLMELWYMKHSYDKESSINHLYAASNVTDDVVSYSHSQKTNVEINDETLFTSDTLLEIPEEILGEISLDL